MWTVRVVASAISVRTVIIAVAVRTSIAWTAIVSSWARTPYRLYIALRLWKKSLHRKTHLAGLLVNFQEFDVYLVSHLDNILNLVCLLPSHL